MEYPVMTKIKGKKGHKKSQEKKLRTQKSEAAMIAGIMEGSPDGIGVAVIRLDCGCRKMAAVDKKGDPASKVIQYRDASESICDKCKEDNGAFMRVQEEFIHWVDPEPDEQTKKMIIEKVLGSRAAH